MRFVLAVFAAAVCTAACASGSERPPVRKDVIRRGDRPLTLVGRTVAVGDAAPDATRQQPVVDESASSVA
jgi:hypothetical protein